MTSLPLANSLWDIEEPLPVVAPGGFSLRDYQREDVEAVMAAFASGHRAVIVRWATGAGKSVLLSELSARLQGHGRVMITVDVSSLATDLVATISRHLGYPVGVCTGEAKERVDARVVVSTVQTLYSGDEGDKRYERLFPSSEFAALLVDECETSLAKAYSGVVRHFKANPDCRIVGTTATPFRGDGLGMKELYDYAADEAGPLNRDILWCRDNGWLVHIKQGFVRVDVDFGSLKIRKTEDGEKDYSDAEIASLIGDEGTLVELARGIHGAAKGEPGIVICPNSTDLADKLAWHLCGLERGCAESVHGKQGRRAGELIAAFKRGDYPFIVSVNKLYKGFDADRVRHVFMARKTKSRRLYEQSLGRGSRPLAIIRDDLNAEPTPDGRRSIIAASAKPHMTMWDLVGCAEKAKDLLGVIDILHGSESNEIRQRAKARMLKRDGEQDTEETARQVEDELREEAKAREARERRARERYTLKSHVETETTDDLRARMNFYGRPDMQGTVRVLRMAGVPEKVFSGWTTDKAKAFTRHVMARRAQGLVWRYPLSMTLKKFGYDVSRMSHQEAKATIEIVKASGWKRPTEDWSF